MGIYDRDYYRDHHKTNAASSSRPSRRPSSASPSPRSRFPVLRVFGLTVFYCFGVYGFVHLVADVVKMLR